MMDFFLPPFKCIVPRTSGSTSWSCEIEVSHIGKKLSHKGGEKSPSALYLTSCVRCNVVFSPERSHGKNNLAALMLRNIMP